MKKEAQAPLTTSFSLCQKDKAMRNKNLIATNTKISSISFHQIVRQKKESKNKRTKINFNAFKTESKNKMKRRYKTGIYRIQLSGYRQKGFLSFKGYQNLAR